MFFIMVFTILISGCGGGERDKKAYPQTENKPSHNITPTWDKGAWGNLKWQ